MIRKFIYRVCNVLGNILIIRIADKIYKPPAKEKTKVQMAIEKWVADNGETTLRLNYDLNENSIVLDLGGYKGQWTSDIYSRYNCKIFVFEPLEEFANEIRTRFERNKNIKVFSFGLSDKVKTETLSIDGYASSVYKSSENSNTIRLISASDFFQEHRIEFIDLMKINIEGGEYDLLEHLIEKGYISKIKNLQIQFHDFVPDAMRRMLHIHDQLNKSHKLSYHYEFVWENWVLNGI